MNPNTEARSASVPVSLFPAKGGNGKGSFAEGDARHASSWSAAEQVRDCHTAKRCVALCYMQYDIILHFVPVFKPVFYYLCKIPFGLHRYWEGFVKGRS